MVSQFDQLCDEYRIQELVRLGFHESTPNKRFDEIAQVASESIPAPVVLVSFVMGDCQVFKGAVGLQVPFSQDRNTPLSHSFCKYVVASGIPLVVPDARNHPELCTNGAIADLGVVAYMGFPIRSKSDVILGSFCAIDSSKRNWTVEEQSTAFKFSEIINNAINDSDVALLRQD